MAMNLSAPSLCDDESGGAQPGRQFPEIARRGLAVADDAAYALPGARVQHPGQVSGAAIEFLDHGLHIAEDFRHPPPEVVQLRPPPSSMLMTRSTSRPAE